MRLARVRATAYPKLTLSLRVLGQRADGFHDLDALVVSLGQPHDVIEAYAVPAPGGVRVEVVGDDAAIDVPEDHTNLAFIAAEKLLVRAGRSGHGVRLVVAQADSRGRRARRWVGRRGGRAARGAATRRRRHRRRRRVRDRGRDRIRRVVLLARRRGVDARTRRSHRRGVARARAPVPRRDPAVPAVDTRRVPRVGRHGRPACDAHGARAAPRRPDPPRALQRPRTGGGGGGAAAGGVPQVARGHDRGSTRCWPGAARPTWCRSPTPAPSRAWSTRCAAASGCRSSAPPACRRGVRLG